jgi:uncharacterized protein (DUF924 family)
MDADAEGILDFWLVEVGPDGWYRVDDAFDALIRDRFVSLWEEARAGGRDGWRAEARSCLALAILLDQFPRNMFRGAARAFASDAQALAVAKDAVSRGHDLQIAEPERHFFYLPLVHSEDLDDQEAAVRLCRLNFETELFLLHARAHRWVILRFGRFPFRNAALGRRTTPAEQEFLDTGGYAAAMRAVGG